MVDRLEGTCLEANSAVTSTTITILSWLSMISEVKAHEGETHLVGDIPLWQILTVSGLAIGVYVGLKAWRKRRSRRRDEP